MKLTEMFKKWLVDNCGVKADASDDEFRKAAGVALANGTLSAVKFAELSKEPESEAAGVFAQKINEMSDQIGKLVDVMAKHIETQAKAPEKAPEPETKTTETKTTETKADQNTDSNWQKQVVMTMTSAPSEGAKGTDVRVKNAWENYSTTKSAVVFPQFTKRGMPHPKAGMPVMNMGRPMDHSSELDLAVIGAYSKYAIQVSQMRGLRGMAFRSLPEHDQQLLQYAMEKMPWGGSSDGGNYADINGILNPGQQKALIDDSGGGSSGGMEAAPIVFDDRVIQTPLLFGELYPLVEEMTLDRGRRVEGVAVSTVTSSWGGIDDTAIALFNTASYVSEFNTTIYRWQGSIQIGLDFMSDTPIDFGMIVTRQYGDRLLSDLDNVIAAGDGTTQPEGIINKSGTSAVTFGGSTSLANYESLRFGVAKAEHRPNLASTAVFCGTEVSYSRARALPVGASDARRLFGMNYDSYAIMERPYKINEDLTNSQIFYCILGGYRMYRRRGLTLRTSTDGDTLMRKNEMLIVAMARYGGQLQRGGLAAKSTDAPA